MPRPTSKRGAAKLCSRCDYDRYNHRGLCERPGIDAPVTSEFCWSLDLTKPIYCRAKKEWTMTCHTGHRERWLVEYAKTGKKPGWNPY